jgi:hypothetical protein
MQGFQEWAKRHCTIFGLFDEEHMGMVASWQEIFDGCGYSAEHLHAATTWLAANEPPRFASEHLRALQCRLINRPRTREEYDAMLLAQREEREREEQEARDRPVLRIRDFIQKGAS